MKQRSLYMLLRILFTSKPIAEAIIDAYEQGIDVKIVLDKSQCTGRGSLYKFMQDNNVPTRINSEYAIMP
jgi:phosphatidylserine/phosphatidylglycerophosphate/cardiolipin synthase-like enzyme